MSEEELGDVSLQRSGEFVVMMQIDKRNFRDTAITAMFYWAVFISIMVISFRGQPCDIVKVIDTSVRGQSSFATALVAEHIAPYNMYFIVRSFLTRQSDKSTTAPINMTVIAKAPHNSSNVVFRTVRKNVFEFPLNNKKSNTFMLFYDKLLYRSSYQIDIEAESRVYQELENFTIVATLGNPVICSMIMLTRVYGCVLMIGFVVGFAYRVLWKLGKKYELTIEQRMTIAMTVACAVANDPLDGLYLKQPSIMLIMIRVIAGTMVCVLIRYYITVIFDSVRCQRNLGNLYRTALMAAFFGVIAIVDVATSIRHELDMYRTKLADESRIVQIVKYVCELLTIGFDAVYIVMASKTYDETERFRFGVYTLHSIVFLLMSASCSLTRIYRPGNDMNMMLIMMELLSQNMFVALMNYLHWPCTCPRVSTYRKPDAAVAEGMELEDELSGQAEASSGGVDDLDNSVNELT